MTSRSSTTAFAKSARPEIGGVLKRSSLFACLDGTPSRTVVWIHGPPGYGKTTLAASYVSSRPLRSAWYQMDAEDEDAETFFHYLSHTVREFRKDGALLPAPPSDPGDLPSFARRYFRSVFRHVLEPAALVLDGVPDLEKSSTLQAILEAGLPEVPRHCLVIVTARAPPPSGLARLLGTGQLLTLTAGDLRFESSELEQMARLRGSVLPMDALQRACARTEGWVAALVLIIEFHKLSSSLAKLPEESTPRTIFDYLAGEVFDRFDAATRRMLLRVARVPRLTAEVASGLSEEPSAATILLNLAHNDYFVRELVGADERVFVMHPLLREFLLNRAATDAPAAVSRDAVARAARLLKASGQVEDAIALFVECEEWQDVVATVVAEFEELLAQGRSARLMAWLDLLPPRILHENPILQFARGSALAAVSPRAARRSFEEAFEEFARQNSTAWMARCCAGVIEAILRECDDLKALDPWIASLEHVDGSGDAANSRRHVAAKARVWRGQTQVIPGLSGQHQKTEPASNAAWMAVDAALNADFARAFALCGTLSEGDTDHAKHSGVLALCCLLDGDWEMAARSAAPVQGDPEPEAGEADQACRLQMLRASAALGLDDLTAARKMLADAEHLMVTRGDRSFLQYLRCLLADASGEGGLALKEARNALMAAVETGIVWVEALARLAIAQLLFAAGDRQNAEGQLRAAEALARTTSNPLLRVAALFVAADVAATSNARDLGALETAFREARDLGLRHVPALLPSVLRRVCMTALKNRIAPEHCRLLISTARLSPPAEAARMRSWPWTYEISTFGGFVICRSSQRIEFSAKGPGRPVELLKALISLGGRQVRVETLSDMIWPHVEADYAHQSFTATLHRLRRVLGGEDTLQLRDGRLSMNPALFWLDAWALDQVLSSLEEAVHGQSKLEVEPRASSALLDEALELYRGPFLADENEHPAFVARRELHRARLLRVFNLIMRVEETRTGNVSVEPYLRFLDRDETFEALYRHLMLAYGRHGQRAEVLLLYERLRAALIAASLGEPSAETRAVVATFAG